MPLETLEVGSLGTRHALDLAREHDGARFLLASTSEIYGDPLVHPQPENYCGNVEPGRPARRLRRGEAVRRGAHDGVPPRATALDTAIVRIFNTYGPRLRPADGRVVSNFLVQAIAASRSRSTATARRPARSATSTTRSRGLLALLDSDHVGPVNIGNPDEFTMLELAELVLEVTGSTSEIVFEPLPDRRSRRSAGPTSPARASCSAGSRRSSSREGLARTHDWYREERAVADA